MWIARLTEQVIEYLLISSALLFLLGIMSLFAVQLFRIKGKTKIWIYALIFILPVVYPFRSILPESVKITVPLQSEYLKPLKGVSLLTPVSTETSLSHVVPVVTDKIAGSKINDTEIKKSPGEFREHAIDTASMLFANWKLVAAMLWMMVFSIFLIRLIAATHTIKRLLRISTPVTDQRVIELLRQCASDTGLTYVPSLYEVQGLSTPMSMGFIRPVIVLPGHLLAGESIEHLRFTLLHELKHIDQRHNLWLLIESIIGAIYFFHPVIHWAKRNIHEEMEHICDGHVIKVTQKSITYADFLLNEIWQNSPGRHPAFSLPFISSASKTADRIRLILENRVASASMPAREVIVVASVFILFSSFIFFTGAARVQGPEKVTPPISSFDIVERVAEPLLPLGIENINGSSITTPLPFSEDNKAMERDETATSLINSETPVKKEYVAENPGTATNKQMNLTADNTRLEKAIQPAGLHAEEPDNILDDKSDISMNLSQVDNNQLTETLKETLEIPVETSAQKYLGAPVKELTIHRIDNIDVLDQYTILFIMRGGDMYLTRLSDPCLELLYANDFNLPSTTGRISKFDHIQAISNNQIMGTTGMLGEFYPYRYEGTKGEAIKILKKSLLKDLVAERAFKEFQ
ncbi:MAG: M56 family metallopeptidase [Deltaproteobacteria bacterium]|nr:M56 family metallopeptidase [Deltaproteobacteria bacterium]